MSLLTAGSVPYLLQSRHKVFSSLIPRPSPFLFFMQFAFSIIRGQSGRAVKIWEGLGNVCSLRSCQSRHVFCIVIYSHFLLVCRHFQNEFVTMTTQNLSMQCVLCMGCLFIYLFEGIWRLAWVSQYYIAIGLSVYNKLWVLFPDPWYSTCMHKL